jgi:hypothetical protein
MESMDPTEVLRQAAACQAMIGILRTQLDILQAQRKTVIQSKYILEKADKHAVITVADGAHWPQSSKAEESARLVRQHLDLDSQIDDTERSIHTYSRQLAEQPEWAQSATSSVGLGL